MGNLFVNNMTKEEKGTQTNETDSDSNSERVAISSRRIDVVAVAGDNAITTPKAYSKLKLSRTDLCAIKLLQRKEYWVNTAIALNWPIRIKRINNVRVYRCNYCEFQVDVIRTLVFHLKGMHADKKEDIDAMLQAVKRKQEDIKRHTNGK
jgi:hypothetical protein